MDSFALPLLTNKNRSGVASGLKVPSPDIPDHDSLLIEPLGTIPFFVDPLRPLQAGEHWEAPDVAILTRMIAGLGEGFAATAMVRLGQRLAERDPHRPRAFRDTPCDVKATPRAVVEAVRWHFVCTPRQREPLSVSGHVDVVGGRILGGNIDRFAWRGAAYAPLVVLGGCRAPQRSCKRASCCVNWGGG